MNSDGELITYLRQIGWQCALRQVGSQQLWWLATNLPSLLPAGRLYRRHLWIEAMFADLKRHGFDLEGSHLRS